MFTSTLLPNLQRLSSEDGKMQAVLNPPAEQEKAPRAGSLDSRFAPISAAAAAAKARRRLAHPGVCRGRTHSRRRHVPWAPQCRQ